MGYGGDFVLFVCGCYYDEEVEIGDEIKMIVMICGNVKLFRDD